MMIKKAASPITVSLRIARSTNELLEQAAARDHRSKSNFVEVLILRHCEDNAIALPTKRAAAKASK